MNIKDYKSFLEAELEPHRRCFVRKDVLRNFAKLTGKNLYQSLFLIKLQAEAEHLRATANCLKQKTPLKMFDWILNTSPTFMAYILD